MITVFAEKYPGVLVLGVITVIGGGLLAFLALWPRGPGPRPVIFFAVFFGAIVLPQLAFHALDAIYPAAPLLIENEAALIASGSRFLDPGAVFGPSVMPDTLRDIRPMYPGVFDTADVGQIGLTASGASVTAMRFAREAAGREARQRFFRMLQSPETKRDAVGTWIFDWPGNSPKACLVQAGRTIMMWVAGSLEEINALRATSAALLQPPPTERHDLARVTDALRDGGPINVVGLVCYILLLSGLFLKLVTWAGTVVAADGRPRLAGDALVTRLLSVSHLDAPITVSKGRRDDELVVDWKYADAKWLHHAGVSATRELHRLVLRLDPSQSVVRCREFHSETAWTAGMDAGRIRWRAEWGITFFHYQHERVFGLRIAPDGRLLPELQYTYTFDIREMKNPIIDVIKTSGWEWRPVFFFAPTWLAWLHG
jgi:hypothetical protein